MEWCRLMRSLCQDHLLFIVHAYMVIKIIIGEDRRLTGQFVASPLKVNEIEN